MLASPTRITDQQIQYPTPPTNGPTVMKCVANEALIYIYGMMWHCQASYMYCGDPVVSAFTTTQDAQTVIATPGTMQAISIIWKGLNFNPNWGRTRYAQILSPSSPLYPPISTLFPLRPAHLFMKWLFPVQTIMKVNKAEREVSGRRK